MRIGILFCIFLILSAPVFAGTWSDDFSDGILADWEAVGLDSNWDERDGVVVSELPKNESGNQTYLITGNEEWKNYTIEVKANIANLVGGDWCGFVFRYRDENSYYWFGMSAAWTKYSWGTANEIKVQELLRVGVGLPHVLRAEVQGENFKFFVDGKMYFEDADGSLSDGRVGLFMQNSMAEFDDFRVTGPEILDGGPGYAVEPKDKLSITWGKIKQQE